MDRFYCAKCFYLVQSPVVPDECPICHSGSEKFKPILKNEKQTVPAYWREHLDNKTEHICKLQSDKSASSFALISDLHWASNEKHSAALLEEVLDKCDIPYYFSGGDIVCGSGVCPASSLERELKEFDEAFASTASKCLRVLGNHDGAFSNLPIPQYYLESLTNAEIYDYYFKSTANFTNRVYGPEKTYCYADDEKHKIRYIALNTHIKWTDELDDRGISKCNIFVSSVMQNQQLDWFANVALDVPSPEWTVAACSHEPIHEKWSNSDIILGIINAFKHRTKYEIHRTNEQKPYLNVDISVDYTGKGGNFAVWVAGHTHYDEDRVIDGVLSLATVNDSVHNSASSQFEHVIGTTTEQAFDVFTIDTEAHKIYATRIGCGENREFEYEIVKQ